MPCEGTDAVGKRGLRVGVAGTPALTVDRNPGPPQSVPLQSWKKLSTPPCGHISSFHLCL